MGRSDVLVPPTAAADDDDIKAPDFPYRWMQKSRLMRIPKAKAKVYFREGQPNLVGERAHVICAVTSIIYMEKWRVSHVGDHLDGAD